MSRLLATARVVWAQLTSMRTALALLLLLALAAIPGSFIPQRSISPFGVSDLKATNPQLGGIYEALGLFDVFGSPWFAAIYLLLFVSLIGCIIPRIAVYSRALGIPPARTPRHLLRLPESRSVVVHGRPVDLLTGAAAWLRQRGFRVVTEGDSVAAERGYLREAGNLVFHSSLVLLLIGVAWNNLLGFKGSAIVVEGNGFSNTLTQYDDFSSGAAFTSDMLMPFTVRLDKFHVRFETGPVQHGAAREFRADVTVTDASGAVAQRTLRVNEPLLLNGTSVHLIAHGYAPLVTVRDGSGQVAFSGPVVFLPQDGNFKSVGVINARDARPQRLAFEGFFLPSAMLGARGPESFFPDALNPELFLNVWSGAPAVESGRPENVFTLNKAGLAQLKSGSGDPVRLELRRGEAYQLPDGGGSLTFEGYQRWTKLQISQTPGIPLAMSAIALAVAGLCLSLFVRPRRVWVRVAGDGTAEVAGIDRADSRAGLPELIDELSESLTAARKDA